MNFLITAGLAAAGIWLLYLSRDLIRFGLASYKWPSTEGMIVDSSDDSFTTAGINNTNSGIVPVEYKETRHLYEYNVGGRVYRADVFCFGGHADRAGAAFLIGTKVKVYYHPENPQKAVLDRGVKPGALIGVVFIAGAILYAVLAFRA
jgi:hypothetical protein